VIDTSVKVVSPAKINWNLRILGKREDGFHELESLVSAVTLFDELTFSCREDSKIELTCENSDVPTDQRNLIQQAAALLASQAHCRSGVTCRLVKRIPVGGGLGGGSSNAAATLMALNRLWSLNWPVGRLEPLASQLGSDVSFFLHGLTAVMSGRGEHIKPTPLGWQGWILMLIPAFFVSTAAVYSQWQPNQTMQNHLTVEMASANNAVEWMQKTFNMLEEPAMQVCPQLGTLVERASKLTGRPVRVSGSGSTLFTAFDDKAEAENFAHIIGDELNVKACIVQPVEQAREKMNSM